MGEAVQVYEIADAEEASAMKEMTSLPDTGNYNVEPDFVAMDTESSDCQVVDDEEQGD